MRRLTENFFDRRKEFEHVAMRSDKADKNFSARVTLAEAPINSIPTEPLDAV